MELRFNQSQKTFEYYMSYQTGIAAPRCLIDGIICNLGCLYNYINGR